MVMGYFREKFFCKAPPGWNLVVRLVGPTVPSLMIYCLVDRTETITIAPPQKRDTLLSGQRGAMKNLIIEDAGCRSEVSVIGTLVESEGTGLLLTVRMELHDYQQYLDAQP
jgi:hypothetical protein